METSVNGLDARTMQKTFEVLALSSSGQYETRGCYSKPEPGPGEGGKWCKLGREAEAQFGVK